MDTKDNLSDQSDNRNSPREHLIKMVRVLFGDRFSIECALLDISKRGAKLGHHTPALIPDNVTIRLPNGTAVAGRVRWRTADACGIEFEK
jgi:hypothetical protein